MSQPKTVIVGVASVQEPEPVLRYALDLARELDAALYVVHAFDFTDPVVHAYVRMGYGGADLYEHYLRTVEKQLREEVERLSTSPGVFLRVEAGTADAVLGEIAQQVGADLVVVGATRRGRLGRQLLGTTAERVIRDLHRPVLVLREAFETARLRVVLATDLSDFSAAVCERALPLVAGLAPGEAPELRPLLVVPYDTRIPPPMDRLALTGIAATELDRFLEERQAGLHAGQGTVRIGEPASEIVAEAEERGADLIVVGTHGRKGWSRLRLGSVAASVLRSARGNVLVIPAALTAAAYGADSRSAAASPAVAERPSPSSAR